MVQTVFSPDHYLLFYSFPGTSQWRDSGLVEKECNLGIWDVQTYDLQSSEKKGLAARHQLPWEWKVKVKSSWRIHKRNLSDQTNKQQWCRHNSHLLAFCKRDSSTQNKKAFDSFCLSTQEYLFFYAGQTCHLSAQHTKLLNNPSKHWSTQHSQSRSKQMGFVFVHKVLW